MPARVFAEYMKTATENFPKSVFDYPKMGGSSTYLKIDDVDETVDESEEMDADKKVQENARANAETQQVDYVHSQIEQSKPTKPQKQFSIDDNELIEYDDEKPINSAVPLPGM